jgi:hypothetical protein
VFSLAFCALKEGSSGQFTSGEGGSKKFLKIFAQNPKVPKNAAVTRIDNAVIRPKKNL